MKKTILVTIILLATTYVAAQNTVIVIDNQTESNVTVKCEDNVCTVVIKDEVNQDQDDGIKAEQKLVREYFDGCNTTTCDQYDNCTSTLMSCWNGFNLKHIDLNDTTVTQQPLVAVKPYYISDGPNINHNKKEK